LAERLRSSGTRETRCGVAPGPGRPKQLSLEQAALAECLIELVITFVQRHGFQAKFFVIKNNILPRALQYLHVQPRHVALGTPCSGCDPCRGVVSFQVGNCAAWCEAR